MIESWGPVIGAGIIVGGAAAVQLYVYRRTIQERRKELKRERVNAIHDLYWGLRAMASQGLFTMGNVVKTDIHYNFLMYSEDVDWLRRHFHENGHLLSAKIHECYHEDISNTRTRPRLLDPKSTPPDMRKFVLAGPVSGGNLTQLFLAAKKELVALDPDASLLEEQLNFQSDQRRHES